MTRIYRWQRFYEAAILETKAARLAPLIEAAQAAISARLQQLSTNSDHCAEGRQAIEDAQAGLRVLERELSKA